VSTSIFRIPVVVLSGAHSSTDDCTEPDIPRYPVSLLTLSALISCITVSLLGHYQGESESLLWRHRQLSLHGTRLHCNCNFCHWTDTDLQDVQVQAQRNYAKHAANAVESVILDLRDLMGIDDVRFLTALAS